MSFQLTYITPGPSVLVRRFIPAQEILRTAVAFLGQLPPSEQDESQIFRTRPVPGSNQELMEGFHQPSTTNKSSVHQLG